MAQTGLIVNIATWSSQGRRLNSLGSCWEPGFREDVDSRTGTFGKVVQTIGSTYRKIASKRHYVRQRCIDPTAYYLNYYLH